MLFRNPIFPSFRMTASSVAMFVGAGLAGFLTGLSVAGAEEEAGNWPNFRGPNGNGVAPESARPPVELSLERNLKWKVAIPGQGHSSPIIWGNRIYLMSAVEGESASRDPGVQDSGPSRGRGRGAGGGFPGLNNPTPTVEYQFNVICLHRDTGELLWNKTVARGTPHEGGHRTNTFASASPVTDGQHLWCNFGSRGVWCLDMDGEVVWQLDLGKMQTRNQFGEGASVAVHGDTVVIPWDQERNSFILAVQARTGEEIWRQNRDEVTSWATPVIVPHEGKHQVVTNGTIIRSYDLESGELVWQSGVQTTNPIATPLIWREHAICMTGHRGFSIQAIPLSARGDISNSAEVAWKRGDTGSYVASPTIVDQHMYVIKGNSGILSALDARDGSVVFENVRLPTIDQMYASLVTAGDNIYACGRNGMIVVFRHGDRYQEIHRTDLGEPIDATPAFSGNSLFIRGHQHLYCFEGS